MDEKKPPNVPTQRTDLVEWTDEELHLLGRGVGTLVRVNSDLIKQGKQPLKMNQTDLDKLYEEALKEDDLLR